jgi:hypothetical protein
MYIISNPFTDNLSSLLAFAEASKKYNYTRPNVVESGVIEIVRGRHPLQQFCVELFVENSTKLGTSASGDGIKAMLLTGPNCSGKSVSCLVDATPRVFMLSLLSGVSKASGPYRIHGAYRLLCTGCRCNHWNSRSNNYENVSFWHVFHVGNL